MVTAFVFVRTIEDARVVVHSGLVGGTAFDFVFAAVADTQFVFCVDVSPILVCCVSRIFVNHFANIVMLVDDVWGMLFGFSFVVADGRLRMFAVKLTGTMNVVENPALIVPMGEVEDTEMINVGVFLSVVSPSPSSPFMFLEKKSCSQ